MQKQILLHSRPIQYTLRQTRRSRHLRLSVHADGSLKVSAPTHAAHASIESFITSRAEWILDKIDYFKVHGQKTLVQNTRANYLKYKDIAQQIAVEKVTHFNKIYNFKFSRISIKNQKTRWGSCSRKGNLNFNYKIALLPEHCVDYLVVHELCHLGQMNHSKKFWDLVAVAIPEYKKARAEMKRLK